MKKILDKDFAKGLAERIENDKSFADFMQKDLSADNGTFRFIISSEDKDRAGEVILLSAWDLKNYEKNPVVLFGHSYYSLPIGKATKIYKDEEKKQLIAEGIWASHDQAQTIRKMYEEGFVKTTSVGFIPHEYDEKDNTIITKAELLEFSVVPVPANPEALALAQETFGAEEALAMVGKGMFEAQTRDQEQEEAPAEEAPEEEEKEEEPTEEQLEEIAEEEKAEEEKKDEETEEGAEEEEASEEGEESEEEEETEEEKAHKEKGEVADEDAKQKARAKKWKNFSKVDAIIMAFWKVYFEDETKVGDFKKLLKESIDLLNKVADGEVEKDLEAALLAAGVEKTDAKERYAQAELLADMKAVQEYLGIDLSDEEALLRDFNPEDDEHNHALTKALQKVAGGVSLTLRDRKEQR